MTEDQLEKQRIVDELAKEKLVAPPPTFLQHIKLRRREEEIANKRGIDELHDKINSYYTEKKERVKQSMWRIFMIKFHGMLVWLVIHRNLWAMALGVIILIASTYGLHYASYHAEEVIEYDSLLNSAYTAILLFSNFALSSIWYISFRLRKAITN